MTDPLRDRLVELRQHAIEVLRRDGAEPGELTFLAAVNGALSAIDAETVLPSQRAHTSARAVVRSGDGTIMLAMHQDAIVTMAALDPLRAIELAGELIRAALPRLPADRE